MHHTGQDIMHRDYAEATLIEKLRALRPERVHEVEDFVDFLQLRDEDRQLVRELAGISEKAFIDAWDNQEDAAYDRL